MVYYKIVFWLASTYGKELTQKYYFYNVDV